MNQAAPQLLGVDGRPLSAAVTVWSAGASLTKDQRLALEAGGEGWMLAQGAAGKPVTMNSALTLSAVFACISRTAQAIAQLPLDVFARTTAGRMKESGWLYELLSVSPNADQTPAEFWEGILSWTCARGNGYAEIDYVGGRPSSLLPLSSNVTAPFRRKDGDLAYLTLDEDGKARVIPRERMFHLKGWGFGGDEGLSPIRYGIQSFSSAIAADEAAGRMFGSGLSASGVLKRKTPLRPEQRTQLQQLLEQYSGSERAGKILVLEGGEEFQQLSLSPEDAQMLETRRYSVEEICRWFGVPPVVIGHAAMGQTMWGTGVEQIMLSWLQLGLNPLLRKIEQRIRKHLIPAADRARVYAEFNREALLQMDSAAKAAFLREMASSGTMTANERREKLNMPKINDPAADALFIQGAMVPMRLTETPR